MYNFYIQSHNTISQFVKLQTDILFSLSQSLSRVIFDNMDKQHSTITITFGDQGENHVGMQKIGSMAEDGFSIKDLTIAQKHFEKAGCTTNLIDIVPFAKCDVPEAAILIIRNGIDFIFREAMGIDFGADRLFEEQIGLNHDKKAFMYGRVVNKHARYNLCFNDIEQEPDYESGKGRVVSFSTVPLLDKIRNELSKWLGEKANNLIAEGNYYYDVKKCGIGLHGDSERKRVVGLRLGHEMDLQYQWYKDNAPVGERLVIMLGHGDIYIMSEKAVGTDWKRKSIYTLRHCAGSKKYTDGK